MTPFSSHSPLPCLFLVVQSFWKNLAWSACSSCSLNLFSCVSCPLIFEPCHFFVYHPLTDSCFLSAFLFRAWPDVPFWKSFLSQKQKTKYKLFSLSVFSPGALRAELFFILYTTPFFCRKKGDVTRVFDTPIQRKPTASERQNSTEIVRKRFRSRKHTFPYKAANRLIIVNEERPIKGN